MKKLPLPPLDPLGSLAGVSVLVVGDVMLDTYLEGTVHRISPEAPIPVVLHERTRHVLGGAANAARAITALGGQATLIGTVGNESAGRRVQVLLTQAGVADKTLHERGRPTTEKQRIIGNLGHQLVRLDYEHIDPVSPATARSLLARIAKELPRHKALLLSDYAKGVFSPEMLQGCIRLAVKYRLPVLCDPKPRSASYLRAVAGATLLTPNLAEAQCLAHDAVPTAELGRRLQRATGGAVLVTLGGDGMALFEKGSEPVFFPALATGVVDVSGAGDTVAAVMALSLGAGLPLPIAASLASRAAAVVVEKAGTATVSSRELRSPR